MQSCTWPPRANDPTACPDDALIHETSSTGLHQAVTLARVSADQQKPMQRSAPRSTSVIGALEVALSREHLASSGVGFGLDNRNVVVHVEDTQSSANRFCHGGGLWWQTQDQACRLVWEDVWGLTGAPCIGLHAHAEALEFRFAWCWDPLEVIVGPWKHILWLWKTVFEGIFGDRAGFEQVCVAM